eukprot:gene8907-6243_t
MPHCAEVKERDVVALTLPPATGVHLASRLGAASSSQGDAGAPHSSSQLNPLFYVGQVVQGSSSRSGGSGSGSGGGGGGDGNEEEEDPSAATVRVELLYYAAKAPAAPAAPGESVARLCRIAPDPCRSTVPAASDAGSLSLASVPVAKAGSERRSRTNSPHARADPATGHSCSRRSAEAGNVASLSDDDDDEWEDNFNPSRHETASQACADPEAAPAALREDDEILGMEDVEEMSQRRQDLMQDMQLSRCRREEITAILAARKTHREQAVGEARGEVQQTSKELMIAYSMVAAVPPAEWTAMVRDADCAAHAARPKRTPAGEGSQAPPPPPDAMQEKIDLLFTAIGTLLGEELVDQHTTSTHLPTGADGGWVVDGCGGDPQAQPQSPSPSPSRGGSVARTLPPASRHASRALPPTSFSPAPLAQRVMRCADLPTLLTCFDVSELDRHPAPPPDATAPAQLEPTGSSSSSPSSTGVLEVPLRCLAEWGRDAVLLESVSAPCVALFRWLQAVVAAVLAREHLVKLQAKQRKKQQQHNNNANAAENAKQEEEEEEEEEEDWLDDNEESDASLRRELVEHTDYLRMAADELSAIEELLRDMVKAHRQLQRQKQSRDVQSSSSGSRASHQGPVVEISRGYIFFVFPPAATKLTANVAETGAEEEEVETYATRSAHDLLRHRGDDKADDAFLSSAVSAALLHALDAHTPPPPLCTAAPHLPSQKGGAPGPLGETVVPPLNLAAATASGSPLGPAPLRSVRSRFDHLHGTPRLTTPRIGGGGRGSSGGWAKTARGLPEYRLGGGHPPPQGHQLSGTSALLGRHHPAPVAAAAPAAPAAAEAWAKEKAEMQATIERLETILQKNPTRTTVQLLEKELEVYAADLHKVKAERDTLQAERQRLASNAAHAHAHAFAAGPLSSELSEGERVQLLQSELFSKNAVILELEDKLHAAEETMAEQAYQLQQVQQQVGCGPSTPTRGRSPRLGPLSPTALGQSPSSSASLAGSLQGLCAGGSPAFPTSSSGAAAVAPSATTAELQQALRQLQEEKQQRLSAEQKLNRVLHSEQEAKEALQNTRKELDMLWKKLEESTETIQDLEGRLRTHTKATAVLSQGHPTPPSYPRASHVAVLSPTQSLATSPIAHSDRVGGATIPGPKAPPASMDTSFASTPATSLTGGGLPAPPPPPPSTPSPATTAPIERMNLMELRHAVRQLRQQLERAESIHLRQDMELQAARRIMADEKRRMRSLRSVRLQVLEKMSATVQTTLTQQQNDADATSELLKKTGDEFMVREAEGEARGGGHIQAREHCTHTTTRKQEAGADSSRHTEITTEIFHSNSEGEGKGPSPQLYGGWRGTTPKKINKIKINKNDKHKTRGNRSTTANCIGFD